jgi:uncharacterized delta-60 repeat protein
MKRIMTWIRFTFVTLLLTLTHFAFSQPGNNDPSFNPGDWGFTPGNAANNSVYGTAVQADGKIVIVGTFTSYSGTARNRVARLNPDGTLDNSFNPGTAANGAVYAVSIQADGKIIVGGTFSTFNGTTINRIARLNIDGTLDPSFTPGGGFNNNVWATSIQSDGKIIVGGQFTSFNGVARNRIARLNTDGTLDATFNPGSAANNTVYATTIQADGKVLIGGDFTTLNGVTRNRIARLNADGTLDTGFDPAAGANNSIFSLAMQNDGKILAGGQFTSYAGITANRIVRINSNGTIDGTFATGTGADNVVRAVLFQQDGKILVGGQFANYNGTARNRLIRLNSDGTLDGTFLIGSGPNNVVRTIALRSDDRIIIGGDFTFYDDTFANRIGCLNTDGTYYFLGSNNPINTVALLSNGKIVIGGTFTEYNGADRLFVAGLNSDGTIDPGFNPGSGTNDWVYGSAVQADGKILICGNFSTYNGITRNRIARINPDGSLDPTFTASPGADGRIESIVIQPDGKILIGGWFFNYNGTPRQKIARLNSDGTLDLSFNPGVGANDQIYTLALQADGKILVSGAFTSFNGVSVNYFVRLNSDGSVDPSFNMGSGPNSPLNTIKILSDGKIIIGGAINFYNGVARNGIARLNSDGTIDLTFNPGTGANAGVIGSAIQDNGKIVIVGQFTAFNGTGRNRIARLNPDGSLDALFDPGTGANGEVKLCVLQPDGRIIIAAGFGGFTLYDGVGRNNIARVFGDCNTPSAPSGLANQSFCNAATIANLTATGTGIQWYANSTGGTALSSGTALSNGTTYYATQTVGGCESVTRLAVTVTIGIPNAPTGSTAQTFCNSATVANLTATGTGIQWYASSTGGTALTAGTTLTTGTTYYASQTVSACESVNRLAVTATIITTSAPTGTASQIFCNTATVADLTATGTGIQWYAASTGGTALSSGTALTTGITYYASQTISGCESVNRFAVTVTINAPATPTGAASQTVCSGAVIGDLAATGSNIQWYAAASGGTALAPSTALTNGTTYYASQTISGCESATRLAVTITIGIPNAPTGSATQTFCNAATVANLTATGSNIQWYAASTGGTALAAGTALTNGSTYYASQTAGGCESTDRLAVTATINAPAIPTGSAAQTFCNAATVADLTATGSGIQWYTTATGGTALTSGTALSNGTYYASQTISGCESVNRLAVNVVINAPAAPTGTANQIFCGAATLDDITATGSNITWYDAASAGNTLGAGTALADGVTYYASQTVNSCESMNRLAITVTLNTIPAAPAASASQDFCNGSTVADLNATGSGIQWYATASGGTALTSGTALSSGSYFAAQTVNGCESTDRTEVVVSITTPATPTGDAAQNFCSASTVADLTATGTAIQWYTQATGGTALTSGTALSSGTYYASQTLNGCESVRLAVNVTVTILDASTTVNGLTISANQSGASYTWVDCNNGNQPIAGATAQTYTATANGSYAVIVEQNGCTVTSNCVAITTVGVEDIKTDLFRVYPNPASTMINVEMASASAVRLFDVSGKLLKELNGASFYTIDVTDLTPGMYVIESAEGARAKFVKE